jgi:hypothetical protein
MYWLGHASLLKLVYPAAMMGVGLWLYASRPTLYFGFTIWMWITIPFIRRIVEYQSGFDGANLIMVTPLAVTLLSVITVFKNGALLKKAEFAPYWLASVGIIYGYLVGLPKTTPLAATLSLLEWLLPIVLAFHLHVHWRSYRQHRSVFRSVFRWGILILGVYGVAQFVFPMPWDQYWMTASGMNSIGDPEPFEVRVFSMLNSPGPFAVFMMTGLLIIFFDNHLISRLALGPGMAAFLLSLVRSAWGGLVVAIGYMALRTSGALKRQLVYTIAVVVVLVAPFLTVGPIANEISARVETMTSIGTDNSFRARASFFIIAARWVASDPIGAGLGSTGTSAKLRGGSATFDSGLLAIPYSLGWFGGLMYLTALFLSFRSVLSTTEKNSDPFGVACSSVAFAILFQLIFSNILLGFQGILFWSCASLAIASSRYHQQSKESPSESPPSSPINAEQRHPAHAAVPIS